MKKLSLMLFTCLAVFSLQSCLSDSECKLEGKWKVQSADVQSSKLSPTTVEMTKAEIESSEYEFTADGKVVWLSSPSAQPMDGTWTMNETGDKLVITYTGQTPETFNLTNCSADELKVNQRVPEDATQEAVLSINMVFNRVK